MKKRQGSIDYRNKHFNKAKEQTTWTIKATGMLKVCSILRIVKDVNFEKSSNHRIWIQLRHFLFLVY